MDNFAKTVANCTRLLESDPELALDVRRELTGHLEETAEALRSSGLSVEESEKEALHHFGDATEIGDRLLDSNLSRMRLRARLRRLAIILIAFRHPDRLIRFAPPRLGRLIQSVASIGIPQANLKLLAKACKIEAKNKC